MEVSDGRRVKISKTASGVSLAFPEPGSDGTAVFAGKGCGDFILGERDRGRDRDSDSDKDRYTECDCAWA